MNTTNDRHDVDKNDRRFEYYAFISYAHSDVRWARWLHRKLESYHIPTVIRRQMPHLPTRIRPIFLDTADLSSGILRESLRHELVDSRYLVVICSPHSATSEWVNKEVEAYIELGRADRVLPFIVDGEPYANDPVKECFPPVLRSVEGDVLGLSVQKFGKTQALVKVVAALLSVKFDTIWRRHKRAERQRFCMYACGLLLAVFAVLTYSYGYVLTNARYYKGYVRLSGIMTGISPINRTEAEHRVSSWRISRKGRWGRPFQLDVVDGAGNPSRMNRVTALVANADKTKSIWATTIKLQYKQNGDIYDELVVDERNDIFLHFLYFSNNRAAYLEGGLVTSQSLDGASYVQFVHDERGVEIKTRFLDQKGLPSKNSEGAYGLFMSYAKDFRSFDFTSIDKNERPFLNENGYAHVRTLKDANGDVALVEYLGSDGELVATKDGYAAIRFWCDRHGNIVRKLFLDATGKPVMQSGGFAGMAFACESGLLQSVRFFDRDGWLCTNSAGITGFRYEYDDHKALKGVTSYEKGSAPERVVEIDTEANHLMR
jgi:hypothetical protein